MKAANNLILGEIRDALHQKVGLLSLGYALEGDPKIRKLLYKTKRFIQKDTCDKCEYDLIALSSHNSPVSVYIGCGHTFHNHCVKLFQAEMA